KLDRVDGRLEGLNGRLDGLDGRVNGVEGQFEGVSGHFEGVDGRMEAIDDRLEALSQRLNQLPQTLEVSEVHRRLTELLDRPHLDHSAKLDETVTEAVENSHDDMSKRLASLEETMLALAEALLRPGRDGRKKRHLDDEDDD